MNTDFKPKLPAPLEIDGEQIEKGDRIKIKVPGIANLKMYLVRGVDLTFEMILILTKYGEKWIYVKEIVSHHKT